MDFFDLSGEQHGYSQNHFTNQSSYSYELAAQSSRVAAPTTPPFHFQQPPPFEEDHHHQASTPTTTPSSVNPISGFISPDSIKGAISKIEALKATNQRLTIQKESLSNELSSVKQTCANLRRSLFELQGDNMLLGAKVARWEGYSEGYLAPVLAIFQEVRNKHYHLLRAKVRSVDTKFQTAKKELLHEVEEEKQKSAETTQLMLKELLKEKDAFIASLQRRNASLTTELATSFMMGTPASSTGVGGRSTSGATTPIRSSSSAFPSGRIASSSVSSTRVQPPPNHHSTTPPNPSRGTPRGAFSLPVTTIADNHHQPLLRPPSHSGNGSFALGHDSGAASPNVRQITSPTQVHVPSHHATVPPRSNLGGASTNPAASITSGEFRLSRRPSGVNTDGHSELNLRHSGSQSLLDSAMLGAVGSPSPIRQMDGADKYSESSRWGDVQLSPSTARIMERLSMAPPR